MVQKSFYLFAAACCGGHFTLPYEQKTQQSPSLGRSTVPQLLQRYKNWQLSVGMVSDLAKPQTGQVITDSSWIMLHSSFMTPSLVTLQSTCFFSLDATRSTIFHYTSRQSGGRFLSRQSQPTG